MSLKDFICAWCGTHWITTAILFGLGLLVADNMVSNFSNAIMKRRARKS